MTFLAHFLPLLCGVSIYVVWVEFPRRPACWLRVLSYGYLLGLAMVALLMAVLRPVPSEAFQTIAMCLLIVLGIAAAGVWIRYKHPFVVSPITVSEAEPVWLRWLLLAFAAWLLWRGMSLVFELVSRPMFPWDAWATWAVKAKTWYLDDSWRSFVDMDSWLVSPESRHMPAWFYPDAVPLLEVWFASAAGRWSMPAVLSLWPCLWLTGVAVLMGQLRAFGATWAIAIGAAFAWASLPLVQTHVALAGYADLVVTVVFGAAALALARHAAGHGRRYFALALICTLMLPGIKQEGVLWLLVLGAGMVHVLLPRRWRGWVIGGAAAAVLLWTVLFDIALPLPGLGWVEAGWGYLRVPSSQMEVDLVWRPVLREVLESLLLTPNWHLLWWLSPALMFMTVPVWRQQATMGWMMLFGFALIMFVFFFTDAARWAKDLTAINRVLMHLTLAWVGWLGLLVASMGTRDLAQDRVPRRRALMAAPA